MLNVNEYFKGNVKSIGFDNHEGHATIGVMEPGEYEFSTNTIEYMTVISGTITALLPGAEEWKIYSKGETFTVPKDSTFKLEVAEQTAYSCFYI